MAKARNINKGDWITVSGRPVKVTAVDDLGPTKPKGASLRIAYKQKNGRRSGVLARNYGDEVSRVGSSWASAWLRGVK